MGIPENIDALLVKYDITGESLARIAGVEPSSVTRWRNGSQMRKEPLRKMCEYFGLTEDDILSTRFGLAAKEHGLCSSDGYVDIPVYGEIAAGIPIEMAEIDSTFPVPLRIRAKYPDSGLVRVDGDSFNRRLPNGCLALIDFSQREPNEWDAFAVCVNGRAATIKRVKRLANGYELIPYSYDPTYTSIIYDYNRDDTEEVTIIGKVVWATMPFDYEI